MIFTRRSLQERLDALRAALGDELASNLAGRLNRVGKDRMAAMWETVILHALGPLGKLSQEGPLASGRRPDVSFYGSDISFIADITAVSDDGLDEENPYFELSQEIEQAKTKLGLPSGGLDLRVHSRVDRTSRGERRVLRLPRRAQIREFVRTEITPRLREQMTAGETVLSLSIDDEDIGVNLTIDPGRGRFNSGGFAAYDIPTIKTRNPLFNALKLKAGQLKGAEGLTGVIVGDADCRAMQSSRGHRDLSAGDIALEFLRQNSSVGFVLLLTVEEDASAWPSAAPPRRRIAPLLVVRPDAEFAERLQAIFRAMIEVIPKPCRSAANAALRARETEYDLGFHGAYQMSDRTIRISAREMMETFAGRRSFADGGAKYPEAVGPEEDTDLRRRFERYLRLGVMPTRIEVIPHGADEDDDYVEFTFGGPDPAISPFR